MVTLAFVISLVVVGLSWSFFHAEQVAAMTGSDTEAADANAALKDAEGIDPSN